MKQVVSIISLAALLASCDSPTQKTSPMEDQKKQPENPSVTKDTTPRVTGIGGIFFYSDRLQETNQWYTDNLGIEINDWGSSSFESRDLKNPEVINSLQWKAFKTGDEYFSPSKKDFMINYTVQNLEGLAKKLADNGVVLLDTIATYDYGKFLHIMDAEGNKIELWEPADN